MVEEKQMQRTFYIYFGGFKQEKLEEESAFYRYQKKPKGKQIIHIPLLNLTNNSLNETLVQRFERAREQFENIYRINDPVFIIAYSMGCHVALKFADSLDNKRISKIILLAPDPKYRPLIKDEEDNFNGKRSAFEEAIELWNPRGDYSENKKNISIPGEEFGALLQKLGENGTTQIEIVYSMFDTYAVWEGNLSRVKKILPVENFTCIDNILPKNDPTKQDWIHFWICNKYDPHSR